MPDLAVANAGSDNVSVLLNQQRPCRGDLNCDGEVGFGDINAFVTLLASGQGQPIPCP